MKINVFCVLAIMVFNLTMYGQKGLPIQVNDSKIKPLSTFSNSTLQKSLDRELKTNPKWKNLIAQKKMSVGIVDLSNPEKIRYASINGNHMMYAASLPKIAILLAAMDAIEKGELKETEAIKKDMKIMISKSDNKASTRMIDRLGYEKIESVMTDPKYMFYDENKGGGLWVGKRYGGGGETNREPIKNLSHAASVNQVCRYYYLLAHGKLVNQKRSKQMLDIMGNPDLHHKFVSTLDKIAPNAHLFRKSGSWQTYHSDSILVWGNDPNRRYILVALIDDSNGEQIIRDLVKPIEKALKNKALTSPIALN
ncbi:class A beta-lactamase-related serine hydrolase [Flaviramulus sp. BrNp1-15]|uniref:serine hydrolase n=1 Tax=Flaviramulus sp. BrNp1-15 TaxID=2916754 RepID=UPI001EE90193|nr:serine hydrolase [Flaviramulus sp. BrNp1-15]ULC60805.1 class A beta-lactamase-related serine hydrolase [Flaviramulus sp. BrNp1-15]